MVGGRTGGCEWGIVRQTKPCPRATRLLGALRGCQTQLQAGQRLHASCPPAQHAIISTAAQRCVPCALSVRMLRLPFSGSSSASKSRKPWVALSTCRDNGCRRSGWLQGGDFLRLHCGGLQQPGWGGMAHPTLGQAGCRMQLPGQPNGSGHAHVTLAASMYSPAPPRHQRCPKSW